jgi:hypothetical protein
LFSIHSVSFVTAFISARNYESTCSFPCLLRIDNDQKYVLLLSMLQ